jgi:hypothetical protein
MVAMVSSFFVSTASSTLTLSIGVNIFFAFILNNPTAIGWQTGYRLNLPRWLNALLFVVPYKKSLPPYIILNQMLNYLIFCLHLLLYYLFKVDCDTVLANVTMGVGGFLYVVLFIDLLLYARAH